MSCVVETEQGSLQGKECKTYYDKKYYSFEGIPYAKPPIGKYRFRPPEKPENWNGIRDATKPGNKCCQLNPYAKTAFEGSEDCLYLNVYTPSLPVEKKEKLPVLFFIHGGRLVFGYGDYYKPDYLIKHDVILVTINYRLNVLGFLCLDIPEVPGNAGLKDAAMALRWVSKNIKNFNGDSNNVTIIGESAGGGMAMSFLTSKMGDGLFHKVIGQSGNSISDLYFDVEDPIQKAKVIASNLGKDFVDVRSLYEFLLNVPVEDLIMGFTIAEIGRPMIIKAFCLPVVEKKFDNIERFFDEYPRVDFSLNRYKKVPILCGINSHESAAFLRRNEDGNIHFDSDFYYLIPQYMNLQKGDKRIHEIEEKIRQFYFENKEINEKTLMEYVNFTSDKLFNFDIMMMPEIVAKNSKDVYFYNFKYSGNLHTRTMKLFGLQGSCHGDLIQYQFYRKNKHDKCNEKDLFVIDLLSEAWCNFAKYGKPFWTDRETKWLPYTKEGKHILEIDEKETCVKNPYLNRFNFWLNITGQTSKL